MQGKRQTILIGQVSKRRAERLRDHIGELIRSRRTGDRLDSETEDWIRHVPAELGERLKQLDLVELDRCGAVSETVKAFLDRWLRTNPVQDQTRVFYSHTVRNLTSFLGEDMLLADVGPCQADEWRSWLVGNEGLAAATVSRRVKAARTMWAAAIRWGLVRANPFCGVKAGSQSNDERTVYVPHEMIARVMDSAPDAEWRAIIALARYGGLRTPSETLALRWTDIDWERGQIRIRVAKLKDYEGKSQRMIPLFSELRPFLDTLLIDPGSGSDYVITANRLPCRNLRTRMEQIIRKAKVRSWPRLFQNLRASRETELMRQYDLKTVCAWIGNSPEVAARHYAASIDLSADVERATGRAAKALQNVGEEGYKGEQGTSHAIENRAICIGNNAVVDKATCGRGEPIGPVGTRTSGRKWWDSSPGRLRRCESAADLDSALNRVVEAWPRLSDKIRQDILDMALGASE